MLQALTKCSIWLLLVKKWMSLHHVLSSKNSSIITLSSVKLVPMEHTLAMIRILASPVEPSKQLIQIPTNVQSKWPMEHIKPISTAPTWPTMASLLVNCKIITLKTKKNTQTLRIVPLISHTSMDTIALPAIPTFHTSMSTPVYAKIVAQRSTILKEKTVSQKIRL